MLLGSEVLNDVVRMFGQVAAEAERARIELTVNVGHKQLDGRVVIEAGNDLTSAGR